MVTVRDGIITGVGQAGAGEAVTCDLGDTVLLPAFVNAHTHLELTYCHQRVSYDGVFADWVRSLVKIWPDAPGEDALRRSAEKGLEQSLAAGVATIGDIGYGPRSLDVWRASPIPLVGFLEVLGMGPRRLSPHRQAFGTLEPLVDTAGLPEHVTLGWSPHAPYSVDTPIYERIIADVRARDRLVCTHLAETPDELQLLADGTGPFRELLEQWGLWDGSFIPPGCSPVAYMESLGLLACSPVLVHVNYLREGDLDRLTAAPCHVVYCPRSHAFFGHEPHAYRAMLARGINVCIGTDSLASNDSLSILDELRFMRRRDGDLPGEQILAMGTIAGARALRRDQHVGTVTAGKRADLVVVPLAHPDADDPIDDILTDVGTRPRLYRGGAVEPG